MLSLRRWNPFEELDNLHHDVDRLFGQRWPRGSTDADWAWVPATEVTSDETGWTVRMALPGIDPKDVDVELTDNVLTVKGERGGKEEEKAHHMSEFGYGAFARSFTLPDKVDGEKVVASFENGMLELRLPVAEAAKPRRIAVEGKTVEAA